MRILQTVCLLITIKWIKAQEEEEGIISSHKPIMISEVYREGAMTPKIGNALNLEYVRKLGSQALTEVGMRQHYNLGIQVKLDYKELISSIKNAAEVKVFSSSRRASVLSAISHNLGMFKKQNSVDFDSQFNKFKPLWLDFELEMDKYSDFEAENLNIPLIIPEKRNDKIFLSRLRKICPKAARHRLETIKNLNRVYSPLFQDYYKEFGRYDIKPDYFERNKQAQSFFSVINKAISESQRKRNILKAKMKNQNPEKIMGKWDMKKVYFWFDTIESYIYYFGFNPRKMKDEIIERMELLKSSFLFGIFSSDDIVKLHTTKVAEEISREFRERSLVTKGQSLDRLKYLGFSSNEMGFAAMMTALGITDPLCNLERVYQNSTERKCEKSPQYASNLLYELSEKRGSFFVRVFFNRKRVKFCRGAQEYCPLDDFLSLLDERMVTQRFVEICGNEESIIMPNSHYFVSIFLLIMMLFCFRNKVIEMENQLESKVARGNSKDPFA